VPGPGKRGAGGGRASGRRLKTAKGRTLSSARWLRRQLADPYVAEARAKGYRSRAAFKLIELDDRFHLLAPGALVVDLGAAPGSWSQVAVRRVRAGKPGGGRVLAVDVAEMAPLEGAQVLRQDLLAEDAAALLRAALGGPADVVLSDMAPAATGHRPTDKIRVMALAEAAFAIACEVLADGGALVAKVLQGGAEGELAAAIKRRFGSVRHAKPRASRRESAETYIVARDFRGPEAGAVETV
jgi:23S rRNA (uridine2552-2'-O)-methyltransferase